ncbi:hypothetical protein K438DRAFT_1759855 [Mycena galopus ATCC 62051]|nr:hypothetical protein K438DRAFT_1759855 [Mycena galopus ATCC 62051]
MDKPGSRRKKPRVKEAELGKLKLSAYCNSVPTVRSFINVGKGLAPWRSNAIGRLMFFKTGSFPARPVQALRKGKKPMGTAAAFNFIDIVETGLKVHTKEFLIIIQGTILPQTVRRSDQKWRLQKSSHTFAALLAYIGFWDKVDDFYVSNFIPDNCELYKSKIKVVIQGTLLYWISKQWYIVNSGKQQFNCHDCGTLSDPDDGYYDYATNFYMYDCDSDDDDD